MTTPNDPYEGQPAPEHGQPREQPATPPQQPVYYGQPPAPYPYGPQNPPSRAAWFAIGAGSMFALGVVGLMGLFLVAGLLVSSDPDFDEGGDFGVEHVYYVDQKSVVDAVEVPCNTMLAAGDQIQLFTDPDKAAVGIKAFAATTQGIADAIGTANPDGDSKQWRADWEKISHNLETFATDLKKVGNDAWLDTFAETGQAPIMVRMSYASEANCEIPAVMFTLDPANADYYMGF